MTVRFGYKPGDESGKSGKKGPGKGNDRELSADFEREEFAQEDYSKRGFNSLFIYRDEVVDVRSATDLDSAIRVNLFAARHPRVVAELVGSKRKHEDPAAAAAEIGRSSSSTVFILCVARFQATLNWCIAAMDPSFYGTSRLLIEEGRLSMINLARVLYAFNGTTWNSSQARYADFELVVKVRNELVHDKPLEGVSENIDAEVEKWRLKFRHRVPDLDWIPRVRHASAPPKPFGLYGESAIQRFMKYPVAKWASDVTDALVAEMNEMLRTRDGGMKMTTEAMAREPTQRFEFAGE